jgi:hypothetical protein
MKLTKCDEKEQEAMAANDQMILKQIIQQKIDEMETTMTEGEFFERFVSDQVLKNYDLSYDEIDSGIVDGGDDGGIDAIYLLINGEPINIDSDVSDFKRNIKIDLFLFQAKATNSFSHTSVGKLTISCKDLLNFAVPIPTLQKLYNSKLVAIIEKFRKVYRSLLTKRPELRITYIYATYGDTSEIHPNLLWEKDKLRTTVTGLLDSEFEFRFLGASELLQMFRKVPSTTLPLQLLENATSTTFHDKQGYLCLVSLINYYNFITEDGYLRKNIFEANIRDYQGKVEVNEGIRATLEEVSSDDFWWLNNGITIIATDGTIVGKTISLTEPQVVNGLQTSTEIYNYFKNNQTVSDNRSILVRVIVTSDPASRDRIIKATNSQTAISAASLHATDIVQRNIESFFSSKGGLYYDRRKNFYKNLGYPRDKIISIPFLAQAVNAMALREPDNSRARPSSLLKEDKNYTRIFNDNYSVKIYWICAITTKKVEDYMKSKEANLPSQEKYFLVFHVVMYVALVMMGRSNYLPKDIVKIDPDEIAPEIIAYCLKQVTNVFHRLSKENNRPLDVLAKNRDATNALVRWFDKTFKREDIIASAPQ